MVLPPYREGELHIRLKGKSYQEKKRFYLEMEDMIKDDYEIF